MTKFFSPLKALKVGLTSLALASACLMANTASAFVHTQGTKIVDDNNQPLFFNGTNLGNWFVWEGYMMMNDGNYRTHTQLFNSMKAAFGGDFAKAREFERQWRLNYVTQESIDELAGLEYNSVRVPFNYRLFWNDATNSPSTEGFEYINNLITYCRSKNMYILLDMHGAPGYQNPGDHSDNVDSNADHPMNTVHFLDGTTTGGAIGANVYKAAQVWKHIANYYKGEPLIWGYDLLNEPQTNKSPELLVAYRYIRDAIRSVDNNHTLVVEGDNWASYMDMFKGVPAIDNNVVLETHHYVFGHTEWINDLYGRADLANNLNVPIILGEFGEEDNSILRQMADIGKARYNGTFSWMFKKMYKDRTLWTISPNSARSNSEAAYNGLVNAINTNTTISVNTYNDLLTFANINIRNKAPGLQWVQSFYDATKNAASVNPVTPNCNTRSAYKAVTLPGVVQAEDFDNGCANVVYADSTQGNAGGTNYRNTDVDIGATADSSGLYVGWTSQGEWMEYTVNVAQAGNYTFNFRYAAVPNGATATLTAGANSVVTNLTPTGGWDTWANATSAPIALSAGSQVIRITFNGGSNLNSFSAASTGIVNPVTPTCTTRSAYKTVSLPGVVQAEDFDNGCANVVYADSTSGNAGNTAYRSNTDVDIGTTSDASGWYVGWTSQGEWMEYTVNVAQAGNYTFNFRYAAVPNGATVTVGSGSNSVVTNLNSTGGWDAWANATSAPIALSAGSQVIRITFNGGSNLNSFSAAAVTPSLPGVTATWVQPGVYNIIANSSPVGSGYSGRGLDAPLGGADNAAMQLYDVSTSGGGSNQRWNIQPVVPYEANTYTITNVSTNKALYVSLTNGAVGNSTLLMQSSLGAGNNQKWKFVANANGSLSMVSVAASSGANWQAIDVPSGVFDNGKAVQVWSFYAGNSNQQWKLIAR